MNDKKEINELNFDSAYNLWKEMFGSYVENGRKVSEYFLTDIQKGKSQILFETHEVAFDIGNNKLIRKPIPLDKYEHFWETYEKCSDDKIINSIWQRVDRLSVEDFRRFTGEFYTPIQFASKGLDYITKVVGEKWWESGYRLWDMASGTGNLEYFIPEEALPYCYISTLLQDDADYCKKLFPTATVFQYDYLNDDVNLLLHSGLNLFEAGLKPKLPDKLHKDLADPDIKWIIFINPPFATSNVGARVSSIKKDSVSMTNVRKLMTNEGMGETSRELFSQFLWRINKEFADKQAHLGMFSKIKYINANNDQNMRDNFFQYRFESGFCFPAKTFQGNSGNFPVGFLVWNLADNSHLSHQNIEIDVFNENVQKIGTKKIPSIDRTDGLSKWIVRPSSTSIFPPFTNAISIASSHIDVRDRVSDGFLFSMMAKGNEFANQNATALLSGPYVSAGAFSVTKENFEKAMVVHTVRRLPKASWLNDRDQWMQPIVDQFDKDFVSDCVVWSLFSNSNATASLSGIVYKGSNYEIYNELFPFSFTEVKSWPCSLSILRDSLLGNQRNRFVAKWLEDKSLSFEAEELLEAGEKVFQFFFENSSSLPWPQFKIKRWDVGWYQIRGALLDAGIGNTQLGEVSNAHVKLGARLLPRIRQYGFMQSVENLFEEESADSETLSISQIG
jgi:hypothetical protein